MAYIAREWHNKHISATAVTSHNNEATLGSGVFCGSVTTVMSYYNIANARKGVFCWVGPEAIPRGPLGQISQS